MAPSRIEACSLPSSSVPRSFDVFLSFRGEDTRNTFISHLYTSLSQAELHTFRDDDEIERGKDIKRELEKTIRQSKVAVIVFSANYASSSWCLDELVLINERKKAGLCDILPIFYHVAPDLVRNQKGSFDEAFAKHEERYKDKLQKWRSALKEVADLKGEVLKTDQNEAHFIQSIVKSVRNMLDCKLFDVEPYSVDRISDLNDSTGDWALRVRVLRIWRVMQPKNSNNLKSIEMVLQDQKGDRIQASMAKYIVVKFESLIEELGTYVMRSFIVHANKGNLKPTNHKFKLALFNKTEVERIANFDFECDMFNLRPYDSLLNIKNFDERIIW